MNVAGLDIARCALQPAAIAFEAGGQPIRGGASSGQYPTQPTKNPAGDGVWSDGQTGLFGSKFSK
ncbi:MAG: hypothetical protein OXU66_02245 [Gammaproteobacteria bacterium]|nr:hypothetical protein [Gammaproteobacteria bacterium]MDD9897263.1 hypothetical protein [Gammaproteobacteria bacterium]MDD9957738.1 hypothetical protein [Gammaproteobacteria bacterium]